MALQSPPPPSISPRQMNILRIVASLAWSDGSLAQDELDIMLDQFSGIFSDDAPQQRQLRRELQDYLMQNIPLSELVPKLQTEDDKELVLRLGYAVIACSARSPDESNINDDEATAYQELVSLLGLPSDTVQRIEATMQGGTNDNLVDTLTHHLEQYAQK
jgi:hypothetical protein